MAETDAKETSTMHHMEIHHAANGGHVIHHIAKHKIGKSGAFMEAPDPEIHVFGEHEGHHALAHIAKHMGIKAEVENYSPGETESEGPGDYEE